MTPAVTSLADALAEVAARRQTLEVYTDDDEVAAELRRQFSTRNVDVVRRSLPSADGPGFVVVRDGAGAFGGALSLGQLEAIVSPTIHPPWVLAESDVDVTDLFAFLDDTLFASFDRRQMVAAAREIEERAWRVDAGALHVGFQNAEAFRDQRSVYERFLRERELAVRVYVRDAWTRDAATLADLEVVAEAGAEIGRFWFVLFDGGGSALNACGLLAEECDPGRFRGFWTYDPERVSGLVSYLEDTYGDR